MQIKYIRNFRDMSTTREINRDYTSFAKDCPDRMLVIFRGTSGKVVDVCGPQLPGLIFESDQDHENGWIGDRNGLFVVDVTIENSKTWTDCGDEYDSIWEPGEITAISDEMWGHYLKGDPIWPDHYYSKETE